MKTTRKTIKDDDYNAPKEVGRLIKSNIERLSKYNMQIIELDYMIEAEKDAVSAVILKNKRIEIDTRIANCCKTLDYLQRLMKSLPEYDSLVIELQKKEMWT